jgi:hypothetical protein
MTQVNPPPRPRLPREWVNNTEIIAWTEQLQTIVFQLYNRTGGQFDFVDNIQDQINAIKNQPENNALVSQLFKANQGLPEFTIDTTGFTVDTTFITTDKVIT